jgi:alpha-glucoside transport system substrate-binding protein
MARRRRAVLACLAALAASALAVTVPAGCASQDAAGTVTVLAPWTGTEGRDFTQVLARFAKVTGIRYVYQGTSALDQVLEADLQKGTPPDVAVLARPGDLQQYAGAGLLPLGSVLAGSDGRYGPEWRRLTEVTVPGDATARQYAVIVKVSLKSLIWYDPAALRELLPGRTGAAEMPQTWGGLVGLSRAIARRGATTWCLGMGAGTTTGYPGTDWIEDIVLHEFGAAFYQRWANGGLPWTDPRIRRAWQQFGSIVRTASGGPVSALLTSAGDTGPLMFTSPPGCYLDHTSFIGFYQEFPGKPQPGSGFSFFPFPSMSSSPGQAWEVGADLAGMFHDTPQSRALIRFLASDAGQAVWPSIPGTGVFSANENLGPGQEPGIYSNAVTRSIASILASASSLCFDASDLMPAPLSAAFNQAVLEFLGDPGRYLYPPAGVDSLLRQLDQVRQLVYRGQPTTYECGGA